MHLGHDAHVADHDDYPPEINGVAATLARLLGDARAATPSRSCAGARPRLSRAAGRD